MSMRSKRFGFTLVELLVVIGIIAVLISILLPSLNKARQQAQTATCMSNLKQIGIGYVMYAQENHGYMTPLTGMGWDAYIRLPDNSTTQLYWYRALVPYFAKGMDPLTMDNKQMPGVMKACPSWSQTVDANTASNAWRPGYGQNIYMWAGRYPNKQVPKGSLSYSPTAYPDTSDCNPMVGVLPNDNGGEWADRSRNITNAGWKLGLIKYTSIKKGYMRIVAGDSDEYWLGVATANHSKTGVTPLNYWEDFYRKDWSDAHSGGDPYAVFQGVPWNGGHPTRHGGNQNEKDCPIQGTASSTRARANYLYADGHVQTLDYVAARRALQAP